MNRVYEREKLSASHVFKKSRSNGGRSRRLFGKSLILHNVGRFFVQPIGKSVDESRIPAPLRGFLLLMQQFSGGDLQKRGPIRVPAINLPEQIIRQRD
ncbi:MAG TPA: hypothetical protein VG297_03575 [Bryobacteraceae bacterium]|nr:hypothetical protein [Bryobacteraceae bacterium]